MKDKPSSVDITFPQWDKFNPYHGRIQQQSDKNKSYTKSHSAQIEYPEVIFLGTSNSRPTLTRNVSSILVNIKENNSILMDCGEGSLGQFIKFYGESKYQDEIVKTSIIFISHLHTDHHLGIFEFISARQQAFESKKLPYKKLLICLPENVRSLFASIDRFSEETAFSSLVKLIDNDQLIENIKTSIDLNEIGIDHLETVPVQHVPQSKGLILRTTNGYKLVYSGDCSPSNDLIKRGQNCDLLIHEATFEDSKAAHAEVLMHSTVFQAISVGSKMNAKNIILTHFSIFLCNNIKGELYKKCQNNVLVANDFMRINASSIKQIKKIHTELMLLN